MENHPSNFQPLSRIQILILMAITALILLVVAETWQKLGKVERIPLKPTIGAVVTGIILGGLILIASAILAYVWEGYRLCAKRYLELIITPLTFPDLFWLGILPGVSEELLFRGIMIPGLGYDWLSLVISSVFFGLLHWSEVANWHYVVWATAVGFLLGYSVYLTDNLLVPIIAHSLTNFVSGIFWKWKKRANAV